MIKIYSSHSCQLFWATYAFKHMKDINRVTWPPLGFVQTLDYNLFAPVSYFKCSSDAQWRHWGLFSGSMISYLQIVFLTMVFRGIRPTIESMASIYLISSKSIAIYSHLSDSTTEQPARLTKGKLPKIVLWMLLLQNDRTRSRLALQIPLRLPTHIPLQERQGYARDGHPHKKNAKIQPDYQKCSIDNVGLNEKRDALTGIPR
jgi:hypothetical protein